MREPVVFARNLFKRYGPIRAVDGVDFDVWPGECFGLLGPNGAGKSTLMKMVHGFTPRDGGDLSVFGLDPDRDPAPIKNRLGVVSQSDNLDDELTVRQNLEVYAGYFGFSRKNAAARIASLLEFLALGPRSGARIRELSGGMRRRLAIARALLNDPDFLLLDEPTTGLDPQVRHLIWAKLRELKNRGVTLLLTTHYMEEAGQLCDRLVILDRGRVLAEGRPAALVRDAVPPYVLETVEEAAGGMPDSLRWERHGDKTYVYADAPDDLEKWAEGRLGTFLLRTSNLEDLFLKLTGRDLRDAD